jgi:pyruvate,water dikinase
MDWQLERPEDKARWWVRDALYTVQPRTPLSDSVFTPAWDEATMYVCEEMAIPSGRGFNPRTVNGYTYLSPIPITDEALIEERLGRFLAGLHANAAEVDQNVERFGVEQEAERAHWAAADLETTNLLALLAHWRRVLITLDTFFKLHFKLVFPRHAIMAQFEQVAEEVAGLTSDADVGKLVQSMGMTKQLEFDAGLWRLAGSAIEAGLTDALLGTLEDDLPGVLEGSDAGRAWLGEVHAFLDEHGHRMTLPMELNDPTWREDITPALGTIRTYVAEGGEFDFAGLMARREAEQTAFTDELVAGIEPGEGKDRFTAMLEPVRRLQSASEDDNINLFWSYALVRRVAQAVGRKLAEGGALDDAADVFFLRKEELERALVDLANDLYDLSGWRPLVAARREEWAERARATPPPYIGDLPDELHDLLLNRFWGIQGKRQLDDAQRAQLEGVGASGGTVEGTARVVLTPADFGRVEAGEILVCSATNPAWTPLFSKIGGVVADQGGSLSHAAIVAREYGIPAVLGTGHATARISDGMRLRLDGDAGTVELL